MAMGMSEAVFFFRYGCVVVFLAPLKQINLAAPHFFFRVFFYLRLIHYKQKEL